MELIEFKKLSVPKEYQDYLGVKKLFKIKYLVYIQGNKFGYSQAFKTKQELLSFCEENKITIDDLREVWKSGENNGTVRA